MDLMYSYNSVALFLFYEWSRQPVRFGLAFRRIAILISVCFACLAANLWAAEWTMLGPEGGSARSLAYDPHDPNRIFLGTATGALFFSNDGGRRWSHCAQLGPGDYVLDHIVFETGDSKTIFISAWSSGDPSAGDIFRSRDSGVSWESLPGIHRRSIRALAVAESKPGVLVAGALDGIYRSSDSGNTWSKISPERNAEIRNIESIAIDPRNPDVMYAGTWHLPWKTTNGGRTWQKVSRGMENDSDIFSIMVDAGKSHIVLASTCSGIYRSYSAGQLFHKVHNIPYSARRTHVLRQSRGNGRIVFAGTTEGLWKSLDGGTSWRRSSSRTIVVNDVLVDPRHSDRVLLATDRIGILKSEDGGRTFTPSNHGFAHRYVTAMLVDKHNPDDIYVAVGNDGESGGVFSLHPGTSGSQQLSKGLGGRDVLSLRQTSAGTLVAGTNRGIFILENKKDTPFSSRAAEKHISAMPYIPRWRSVSTDANSPVANARVNDLDVAKGRWFAATSQGLFQSRDEGKHWTRNSSLQQFNVISVQSQEDWVIVASETAVFFSTDGGTAWRLCTLPKGAIGIRSVVLTTNGEVLIASVGGGFVSSNGASTWRQIRDGLPDRDIRSICIDERASRLLATSGEAIFESRNGGQTWDRGPETGFTVSELTTSRTRILAASASDGVMIRAEGD